MFEVDEPADRSRDGGNPLRDEAVQARNAREAGETSRPAGPTLDDTPLPDELTGRASKTSESLTTLFQNETPEHLADGFRGASGDDPDDIEAEDTQPSDT